MIVEQDAYVQIVFDDRETQYGKLHCDIETAGTDGDELMYFRFDPLTSFGLRFGLCTAKVAEVAGLNVIPKLPVSENYVIDSLQSFFHGGPTSAVKIEKLDSHAGRFLQHFGEFAMSTSLIEPLGTSLRFNSHDCSELGLDYMRQHYRAIKQHFLCTGQLPRFPSLKYLLELTTFSRTSDADWAHCRIPG